MSDAGAYSDRGDDYQRAIALKWAVSMLSDEKIASMEVQVTSLGPNQTKVDVDDIAIHYRDGSTCYLQCKKNQTDWREWRLTDKAMIEELIKSKQQLLNNPQGRVAFWSQSEFGELKKLREYVDIRADYQAFTKSAPKKISDTFHAIANLWQLDESTTFALWQRMEFHTTGNVELINQEAASLLKYMVNRATTAVELLLGYITAQSGKRAGTKHQFSRTDVINHLAEHGILKTPVYAEQEILQEFSKTSSIGRQWIRDIGGKSIRRLALDKIHEHIVQKAKTVLVTDEPGGGKTCLLLDIADSVEKNPSLGLLFIKADSFATCANTEELTAHGLPDDWIGKAARLADFRQVIVIMDSLDVLSLNRANGALQVFLAMLDQLERIPNVTTIAACREFDRRYDQHLKARQWQHVVSIGPLSWDDEVSPFLKQWDVDATAYSNVMKTMLCNPRKLKLFEELANRGQANSFESEQELIQHYLQIVVLEDPLLGQEALKILQSVAKRLIREHGQWLPITAVEIPDIIRQKLLSSQILMIERPGMFGFSHQTLVEGLAIQSSITDGQSLLEFLREHPPLPTLRPVVRAFFFYLRASQHNHFRRQVREVLDTEDIAFHLKRLIAESLGEIQPEYEDWSLIGHLYRQHPELFKRFLWSTVRESWLIFLKQHWLPLIRHDTSLQLGLEFLYVIERWIKILPTEVIKLWLDAYTTPWADQERLRQWLPIALEKLEDWKTDGVRALLVSLLEAETHEHDFLGKALGRWVEANDMGDDMLWSFISKDVTIEDIHHYRLDRKLHCDPHTFSRNSFLCERMTNSTSLLDMAISSIDVWTRKRAGDFLDDEDMYDGFLHNTSWERVHSSHDRHHIDNIDCLMNAVETALSHHAGLNSDWWQAHVNQLLLNAEAAIRYFVLRCCIQSPETNVESISKLLLDRSLLRSRLYYELAELITAAFYLLDSSVQESHQQLVLGLYVEDVENGTIPSWAIKSICMYLERIPAFLRTPEAQSYLDLHLETLPPLERRPYIHSSGGFIGSPIDEDVVLRFSNQGLLTLFRHYSSISNASCEEYQGRLIGGEEQIASVVREAASRDPERFILMLSRDWSAIPPSFSESIMSGVTNHVRYRFGNLQQPQNWKAQQLPDGEMLALNLLDILESNILFWTNRREGAEAIRASADSLNNEMALDRLVSLCAHFITADEPSKILRNGEEDLIATAINSIRGVVAEALIQLANRLLEQEKNWPKLLIQMLSRFAEDSNPAVRAILLLHLPYLQHRQPDFGWKLFESIMVGATPEMWKLAERCLYYGYEKQTQRVEGYLERIRHEAIPLAGQTWGRIATLMMLSNHSTKEDLFGHLIEIDSEEAWIGAVDVFTSNINKIECNPICVSGLLELIKKAPLSAEITRKIGHIFSDGSQVSIVPMPLIKAYFDAMSLQGGRHDPYHFVEWLVTLATYNPLLGIEACELLIQFLEQRKCDLWHTEPIAILLTTLFREAEDANNMDLIVRVVNIQDALFKHITHGMDEWLRTAERY